MRTLPAFALAILLTDTGLAEAREQADPAVMGRIYKAAKIKTTRGDREALARPWIYGMWHFIASSGISRYKGTGRHAGWRATRNLDLLFDRLIRQTVVEDPENHDEYVVERRNVTPQQAMAEFGSRAVRKGLRRQLTWVRGLARERNAGIRRVTGYLDALSIAGTAEVAERLVSDGPRELVRRYVGEGARGSDSLTAPGSNARRYRVLTLRSDGRLVVQLKDSWDWGEGPAEGTRERKLSLAEASQQFGPKIVRRAFRKYVEGRPDYYGETIK